MLPFLLAAVQLLDDRAGDVPLIVLRDEARGLEAAVAPSKGGEMSSFKVRHRGQWVETLYRARDYSDQPGWTGKAPFLWPATGRNFPKDVRPNEEARGSSYDWNGQRYPMPIHGFARDMLWTVEERGASPLRLRLSITDSEATRKSYPWGFHISVEYMFDNGKLGIDYVVTASKSNREAMPFSAGNHITFKAPLVEGTDPMKMRFETPSTVEFLKAAGGLPTGEKRAKSFAAAAELSAIERLAAVSLGGYQGDPYMILRDPGGITLKLSHTAARVPQDPLIRFNVWGDPASGYFSPEPWVGLQNSFNRRQGLVRLQPGERWTWRIVLEAEFER